MVLYGKKRSRNHEQFTEQRATLNLGMTMIKAFYFERKGTEWKNAKKMSNFLHDATENRQVFLLKDEMFNCLGCINHR